MSTCLIDGRALTRSEVAHVARTSGQVVLSDDARARVQAARDLVAERASGSSALYGINTGFGSLSRKRIEPDAIRAVQRNLIRSHAAGVGPPLPDDVVRAMMLLLVSSLSRGFSGCRPLVIDGLIGMLNANLTPLVPSRGSVGASGDLAPLAHVALALIGEGEVVVDGAKQAAGPALAAAGLKPVELDAKEGLALINGTHLMCGMGTLVLEDTHHVITAALGAAAMAVDACRGTDTAFDARLHAVRGQPGQIEVAAQLREMLKGSTILASHREHDPRVQDPYCLRAAPQVIGAALDTIKHIDAVFARERGAVTDNPLVFADDGDILSGGNFHGMPLAIALDTLPIALCHIAGISERRVYWLLAATDGENPVNVYLSPDPGLHSGLMIAQYTAAACCNELQTLCAPASVGNIPTSAGIEDYNSMGATAALQAHTAIERAREVIAIELLVMAEALEYHRPQRSGAGVEAWHDKVRAVVPRLTEDRPPAPDIAALVALIQAGSSEQNAIAGN